MFIITLLMQSDSIQISNNSIHNLALYNQIKILL